MNGKKMEKKIDDKGANKLKKQSRGCLIYDIESMCDQL